MKHFFGSAMMESFSTLLQKAQISKYHLKKFFFYFLFLPYQVLVTVALSPLFPYNDKDRLRKRTGWCHLLPGSFRFYCFTCSVFFRLQDYYVVNYNVSFLTWMPNRKTALQRETHPKNYNVCPPPSKLRSVIWIFKL